MKAKNHMPEGYRAISPHLVVTDANKEIEFLKKAFGAQIDNVAPGPGGKGVMHAVAKIGDALLTLSDVSTEGSKRTTANTMVYVKDVDTTFKQALAAGAKQLQPVSDQFWGDRWGLVEDPFGNQWQIATHVEDLSPEEMQKRLEQWQQSHKQ